MASQTRLDMSRLTGAKPYRPLDENDVWIEDYPEKQKDLEDLERLKREGIPAPDLVKSAIDGVIHRFYEPNTERWWFDEDGRTIKNPERYKLSPEGMPILKEEFMATKKLEKTMSAKAVKGKAKPAGDQGAPEFPWAKKSEAASAGGKGKKAVKMLPKKKGNIKELNA